MKLEKVNERALRFVYKDKTSYQNLLARIEQVKLEDWCIQDMFVTISKCFNNTNLGGKMY